MNNFNFIAPVYDWLAHLCFGKSIDEASACFLDKIQRGDSVLVLGGGTGKILSSIPGCKRITYLEKSLAMINRAKTQSTKSKIEFIKQDFLEFQTPRKYDVIICPFFLDCFNEQNLIAALDVINDLLEKEGRLIVSDFQSTHNQWVIRFMHLFFHIFSSLESKKLKDIHYFIVQNRFKVEKEEFFHKNMIFSRLYRNL